MSGLSHAHWRPTALEHAHAVLKDVPCFMSFDYDFRNVEQPCQHYPMFAAAWEVMTDRCRGAADATTLPDASLL
jgi:hypothetical protein